MKSLLSKTAAALLLLVALSSCTYLKHYSIQADYARLQKARPSQVNLKHMLDRETVFVIGKTIDTSNRFSDAPMVVAAYSSQFNHNELVDRMFFNGSGTHFGLNLPPGEYDLVVFADLNNNALFEKQEAIGHRRTQFAITPGRPKVASQIDVTLNRTTLDFDPAPLPAQSSNTSQSLVYPEGTIRQLNDPIFEDNIATLGMYDPASFLEYAPTMFYALEDDQAHKIPVVFVHGINGGPRAFTTLVDSLDHDRYRPWFFYYPSGGDLDQLADLFYHLFLSGKVIPLADMPMIIVAHSMGGLVVRQSFNKLSAHKSSGNRVERFISIATPFGGHPDAATGVNRGLMVLPAWRDLDPNSAFIRNLYSSPLPQDTQHHLYYAYKNSATIKLGENSDGVVPLSSQLHPLAQRQSLKQYGFQSGHNDVLENPEMIEQLKQTMSEVRSVFPDDHLAALKDAGFDLKLDNTYDPKTKHIVRYAGKYVVKLINGALTPITPEQERTIKAIRGEIRATTKIEKDFIRLRQAYPQLFLAQ